MKGSSLGTDIEKGKRGARAEQMWTLEEAMNVRLEQQPKGQPGKAGGLELMGQASSPPHCAALIVFIHPTNTH